jgi:hypothetical protein
MSIDPLSEAEHESQRFFSFGGHTVKPLGKKTLTWRARNGIDGRHSGPAQRGQKRTTVFYVAPELRQDTPSSEISGETDHEHDHHHQPAMIFGKETCRATGAVACRPILALVKSKRKKKTEGT